MSAQFFNQIKHLQMRYDALQKAYDDLAERVLELEAGKEPEADSLDVDTLEQVLPPKRRGRTPKVKAEE